MARLVRDGVTLAYDDVGRGTSPLVFIHGVACHRGFWAPQRRHFARRHRVVALDLRGHGESDAPEQAYTIAGLADDVAWICGELDLHRPVLIGHSLGGLVALELAASHRYEVAAIVLIDSVLLAPGDRGDVVERLVNGVRSAAAERVLRDYFSAFFAPEDAAECRDWILDQALRTPGHVTSSVWEQSRLNWDDADALRRCRCPALYLDAGTPNADIQQAVRLCPYLTIARTTGSGHFSPLFVPRQVNAELERFIAQVGER